LEKHILEYWNSDDILCVCVFDCSDAKKKGYVATITGRKRFLPDITSSDTKKRSQAERQAVNSVIQGDPHYIYTFDHL
jgi:hypothetical protein